MYKRQLLHMHQPTVFCRAEKDALPLSTVQSWSASKLAVFLVLLLIQYIVWPVHRMLQ